MTVKMTIWMNVAKCMCGVTMMMIMMLICYRSVVLFILFGVIVLALMISCCFRIHRSSKHKRQSNKPTTPGFWSCKSDPRCAICKEGYFSTSITSHHSSKTHNIKQSVTCKSKNVCYLIDCSKCKQKYVGETKLEFHCRMNDHKSDIRLQKKSNGMVRHFSTLL